MKELVVFFLRAYNDIDHIVPVIYKAKKIKDWDIKVIMTDYLISYDQDYRIKFIKENYNVKVDSVIEFMPINGFIKSLFRLVKESNNGGKYFIKKALVAIIKKKYLKIDYVKFVNNVVSDSNRTVFVFDHQATVFSVNVIQECKKRNIKSLAFPHAIDNWDNELIDISQLNPLEDNRSYKNWNLYDAVVFPDKYFSERIIKKGLEPSKVKIIGSARFSKEWISILQNFTPKYKLPFEGDSQKLKIVYFLTKPTHNVFQDEVERFIDFISRFEDVYLIVKPHTRGMQFKKEYDTSKICIVDNNIPSQNLIDWADLQLFTATSVIIESLIKDKPVLYLRKTLANKLIFERFINSWDIETRDQLRTFINEMLKNRKKRAYTVNEANLCLKELVNDDGTMLQKYVDLMSSYL